MALKKINILMVDDSPEKLFALEAVLESLGQNIVKAHTGREALRMLLKQDFAVILLDVRMPGIDGFETAQLIRQRKRSEHTPIIFISGINVHETHVQRGYSLGAVDYLFAPIEAEVLRAKVSVFIELFRKTEEINESHRQLAEAQQILLQTVKKLKTENKERVAAESKILEISGREQRRMGQELHDGLGQTLTGISFMVTSLARKLAMREALESPDAFKISILVNEAITKTREMARGFYPVELESNGLISALEELASRERNLFNVNCHFHAQDGIGLGDLDKATQVYRIAQEAIENAIKHGEAKNIQVKLLKEASSFRLTIEDDGIGFPKKLPKKRGMGLQIMKYRAGMIQGAFDIQRQSQRGTIVTCSFPNNTDPQT
jgi:signal transduction histidine kinase